MSLWKTISNSRFPHERDALEFLKGGISPQSKVYAWSNFEFVADTGSIYEVDVLIVSPWGAFLVEIKSRPGAVSGSGNLWCWHQAGSSHTADNPLLLANQKAKALKSILARQKAFKQQRVPFIESLIFLSHGSNTLLLKGNDAFFVTTRDTVLDAICRRQCAGLRPFHTPPISQDQLRAFDKAMEQAGFRELSSSRRAGDYTLESLIWDCPTGNYQDWIGHHSSVKSGDRLIRIYLQHHFANDEESEALRRAADREYRILSHLDHPGILRAETLTQSDSGPAVVFRFDKEARRLDHFLEERRDQLSLDQRIDLLRKITEAIAYAHGKGVIHRSLSPQSILVMPVADRSNGYPSIKIHNWQIGLQDPTQSQGSRITRLSRTLHVSQWVEDASRVYLAPEIASGQFFDGTELDSFSLGAIAYTLFSGHRPADSLLELNSKLRDGDGYLDLRSVVNSPDEKMVDLIRFSACADRGKRFTADEFLNAIEQLEDSLTSPTLPETIDPRAAHIGDLLDHGLRVKKILGTGSISRVLLVEKPDQPDRVLKAASSPEHNDRILREYETLQALSFQGIVKAYDCLEFGDIRGFTMDLAGEETLAKRLRDDGKLEIDFLERFGKQLLQIVDYLDQQGTAHRDIKPHNIGIGLSGKGALRLVLFDFSLSQSPVDQIQVGTQPYLDPFLENRRHRCWDSYAERFAAAMTLYEMATGSPATFGDGASAAHLTHALPNVERDLFPEGVRESMATFFAKALHPDCQQRHDNAEEMLRCWVDIFAQTTAPAISVHPTVHDSEGPVFTDGTLADATLDTPLILLGLSTRLANAFDRIGLNTVKDLMSYPLGSIQRMRGVGYKTRNEAKMLFRGLRKRLDSLPDTAPQQLGAIEDESAGAPELASVDIIVKKVLAIDSRRQDSRDFEILSGYLGMACSIVVAGQPLWPSQSDFASSTDLTRARIGQIITRARERWSLVPALTGLRDTMASLLSSQGGVMTLHELIQSVLHLRGSLLDDPERQRMASVAARAAVETERGSPNPRFSDYRRGDRVFIALNTDLADYARDLGTQADAIAQQDPLPTPARVVDCLQRIDYPLVEGVSAPGAARIAALAVASSASAALSARLEIYPKGLSAERALRLAQNNLFGSNHLTVEAIQQRIASRYPESEPLPGRPALDHLLAAINLPLRWSDNVEAYTLPSAGDALLSTGITTISRTHTRFEPSRHFLSEAEAEAQRVQDKLEYGIRQGSYYVLAAEAQHLARAEAELLQRFDLHRIDGDRLFLDAMRQVAEREGARWDIVLEADAADPGSSGWRRLIALVDLSMPKVRSTIEKAPGPVLLTHPGLFIRYQQLHLLDALRNQVGTHKGPPGLWLLIPGGDHQASLGGAAIPILNPAHFEKLNEAWLANKPIRHPRSST